jgi:hypothetical protein
MEWTMFVIAASILALPIPSYVMVWSWGLATLVMALVGTKLASVVVCLAAQVSSRGPWMHVLAPCAGCCC